MELKEDNCMQCPHCAKEYILNHTDVFRCKKTKKILATDFSVPNTLTHIPIPKECPLLKGE